MDPEYFRVILDCNLEQSQIPYISIQFDISSIQSFNLKAQEFLFFQRKQIQNLEKTILVKNCQNNLDRRREKKARNASNKIGKINDY